MQLSDYVYVVTGGAGFIGSHIVEYLSYLNCKVIVIDNLSTGNKENIKDFPNVEFIQTDINDTETLKRVFKNVDFIFHLAALGSINRSVENPMNTHLSNATGFLNVLNVAKENKDKVKGIIYASSSSVYGDNQDLPKKEDKTGMPLSPYAVTKITNELYAKVFWKIYGLPTIGLRYFNIFGPRQNPEGPYAAAIPLFIQKMIRKEDIYIHGTGEQKRDFTYVENVVNANINALYAIIEKKQNTFGEVFNIGCHQSISINQVFKLLSEKLNYSKSPIYTEPRKGDVFQSLADITKAEKFLNYRPKVFFEEGIEKMISFILNPKSEKI